MTHEPTVPMAWSTFGDAATLSEVRWPRTNPDGTVHLRPEDGTDIIVQPVRTGSHYHQAFPVLATIEEMINAVRPEKNTVMIHQMELMVTDARVIVHSLDPKRPGQRIVGHLWYPWISTVGYRPKQSFLNESSIELGFREDFADADSGMWWERLELDFEKTFDPGDLAREIVRRIARYDLAHAVTPPFADELTALLDPQPLPPAAKGEYATYAFPTYVAFPGGVEGTDWVWTTPDETAKTDDAPKAEAAPPSQAPGWYGVGAGRSRWWDGTAWTEHYTEPAAAPAAAPAGWYDDGSGRQRYWDGAAWTEHFA